MVTVKTNFTLPSTPIDTVSASLDNEITKEYYNHLVGEINRGTIKKAVCVKQYFPFGTTSYHLISLS